MKKLLFVMLLFLSSCAVPHEHQGASFIKGIEMPEFSEILQKAESGDASAQLALADIYRNQYSSGGKESFLRAIYWNEQAGERGLAVGYFKVGIMYQYGWFGHLKDLNKSKEYFSKAAENGHVEAMISLGKMYFDGEGVQKDFDKGVFFYKKAAASGNIHAQIELGEIYYKYATVPNNIREGLYQQEARYWLTKATETPYADRANKYLNNLDEKIEESKNYERVEREKAEQARKRKAEIDEKIVMRGPLFEYAVGADYEYVTQNIHDIKCNGDICVAPAKSASNFITDGAWCDKLRLIKIEFDNNKLRSIKCELEPLLSGVMVSQHKDFLGRPRVGPTRYTSRIDEAAIILSWVIMNYYVEIEIFPYGGRDITVLKMMYLGKDL